MDRIGLPESNFEDKLFYDKNKRLNVIVILIFKSENLVTENSGDTNLTPKYNQKLPNLILPKYVSLQTSSPYINTQKC